VEILFELLAQLLLEVLVELFPRAVARAGMAKSSGSVRASSGEGAGPGLLRLCVAGRGRRCSEPGAVSARVRARLEVARAWSCHPWWPALACPSSGGFAAGA